MKVPKLANRGNVEVYLDRPGDSIYPNMRYLKITKARAGLKRGFYRVYDYTGVVHQIRCRVRGSWSTNKGLVKISAPKRCIGWNQVKARISTYAPGSGSTYGYDSLKKIVLTYN